MSMPALLLRVMIRIPLLVALLAAALASSALAAAHKHKPDASPVSTSAEIPPPPPEPPVLHEDPEPVCLCGPPPHPDTPPADIVDQFSQALKDGRVDLAARLLAKDVLVLESGGAERSKAEYLATHAGADAEFLKTAHVVQGPRRIRELGDLAWVGSEVEIHASKNGEALTWLGTETMVLERTAAGWRIVHIHWSSRPKKQE